MIANPIDRTGAADPAADQSHKLKFFRQSSWMMITGFGMGLFMWGVHFLSKRIGEDEYRTLGTLLALIAFIPAIPLQMVFAQQAAAALATHRERQLAGMIRLAWLGTLGVCAVGAGGLLLTQEQLLAQWHVANPVALWATLLAALFMFWMPMFTGLMLGQQNFLWLGWTSILNGVGRLGTAALLVLALGSGATGVITGVVIGLAAATGVGIWQTRSLWARHAEAFDRRAWLNQVLPLLLGFCATQFLFTGDVVFVNKYLPEHGAFYVAAGTLSRALIYFVGPLSAVMFPKIVHSTVRSEHTDLLGLTLLLTAALTAAGAVALWILGPWAVRFVYTPDYVPVTTAILPWYAGAMVPLCLANVLVNNLLARSDFRVVPPMVVLAIAYGVTLTYVHGSLVVVLQTLGLFNLALLGVCAFFTWGGKRVANTPPPRAGSH